MKRTIGVLVIACGLSASARADDGEAASCVLRVVSALPGPGGMDPNLAPLKARLERPPFLHWKTFHLISEAKHTLKPTESVEFALPGGRTARLVYAEHDVVPSGKHRVRGSLAIDGSQTAARTMFSLDEGGVLLIAGQPFEGGILIYALSCTTSR